MRVFEQGSTKPVDLGQKDFRARGGQGAIYVCHGVAYKIFGTFIEDPPRSGNLAFKARPDWALPQGRISELSQISVPEAVKPEKSILDSSGTVLGHTMQAIEAKYVMTATLPRVFRERESLKPEDSLRFVQTVQKGIKGAHAEGFKLCDIQPNNFLVTEDFKELYIIDVDSWATPHYPALALIESARDWVLCPTDPPTITEETDWYSFAVLAFEIFIGIHPFKGRHKAFPRVAIRQRMEARLSVLNSEVHVDPDCIMPLSLIPPSYRDWFEATFEQGKRIPPPEGLVNVVRLVTAQQRQIIQGAVKSKLLRTFDGDLIFLLPGDSLVSTGGVYRGVTRISDHEPRAHYAITPRGQKVIQCALTSADAMTGMRKVSIKDVAAGADIASQYEAHDIMSYGGKVLIRVADQLLELSWFEGTDGKVRAAASAVAQVSQNTTRLFPGLALQSLLGATFATLLPVVGGAYEVRLRELEGKTVLDARLEGSVLQVATEDKGRQSLWTFRFAKSFISHDAEQEDITATGFIGLNFAVLDTGVCVENRGGELRMYAARPGSSERKVIPSAVPAGLKLFADGARLLGVAGGEVLHLMMGRL
jgi:serine/threonine protein kinase